MIFRIIICWYAWTLMTFTCFVPRSKKPSDVCVTGLMTDKQSWVSLNGKLLKKTKDAVDLYRCSNIESAKEFFANQLKWNVTLKFLGFAKSNLNAVPPINLILDSELRPISETIEFITFYDNDFSDDSNGSMDCFKPLFNESFSIDMPSEALVQYLESIYTKTWYHALQATFYPKLRDLDLRSCRIRTLDANMFKSMPILKSLFLSYNNIITVSSNAFVGLGRLLHLDLSRNSPDVLMDFEDLTVLKPMSNLRSLDMSFTKIITEKIEVFKHVSTKLQTLSICEIGVTRSIEDSFFQNTSLKFLDVSGNKDILNRRKSLCGLEKTLEVIYASGINLMDMAVFDGLEKLIILKAEGNQISALSKRVVMQLKSLEVLNLNSNKVISWFVPRVTFMPKLKVLLLLGNNINVISKEMLRDLHNLEFIGLSQNILVCDCYLRDFYEMAAINERNETYQDSYQMRQNDVNGSYVPPIIAFDDVNDMIRNRPRVKSRCGGKDNSDGSETCPSPEVQGDYRIVDYEIDGYQCLEMDKKKTMSVHQVKSCNEMRNGLTFYGPSFVGKTSNLMFLFIIPVVLIVLAILAYTLRRNLRYCFITIKNSAMLSLINKDEIDDETIFHYDVFVSYCNDDRAWVLDHLLPHLEQDCNVNVCLHERDFQVGLSILENIVSCMDRSKSIMLVLSQKFLRSQWCQFEMHLAQHRLLETRREDLTIILLEDIPRKLRPNTLHYLMITKTYIVWPRDEKNKEERDTFWKRLKKGLSKVQEKTGENHSLA